MIITHHLTNKLLPIVFTRGYLQAGTEAQGHGPFTACYRYAAHTRDPGEQLRDRKAWMEPLYTYVGESTAERQDLDYFYVRLLYEGMTLYAQGSTQSCEFTNDDAERAPRRAFGTRSSAAWHFSP